MNQGMKLFILFVFLIASITLEAQSDFSFNKNLDALKAAAEAFQPTYILGTDTMAVAKIPKLPDSLNSFVYYCMDNKIDESYKYCFLMVMKLSEEFMIENKQDYDFCEYKGNAIIDLVFSVIERGDAEDECFVTKTLDVYFWLTKNKQLYKRYPPLLNQMKRVKKAIKRRG